MSNRFKPKRNKALRQQAAQEALKGSGVLNAVPGLTAQEVNIPSEEKVLLKTVPLTLTRDDVKHEIGIAHIYDDRSVDYLVDDDAPQWAKDEVRETEQQYSAFLRGNAPQMPKEN